VEARERRRASGGARSKALQVSYRDQFIADGGGSSVSKGESSGRLDDEA
jgi:hypothetical protein